MISNVSKILYIFLFLVPFAVIRYYPFRDRLRVSIKVLISINAVIISIQVALFCFLSSQTFWNFTMTQVFRMGLAIFYIVFSIAIVKENLFKQFYIWSLMFVFGSFIFANANFIEARFFLEFAKLYPYVVVNIVMIIQILIFFPFVFKLIDTKIIPILYSVDSSIWNIAWVIPISLFIGFFLTTWSLELNKVSSFSYLLIRHFYFWSMLFVTLVLFEAIKQTAKNVRLSENILVTNSQLTLERKHYQMLTKHIEEIRRVKHDFRHHLSLMYAYLIDNNIEKLKEYMEQYQSIFPKTFLSFCNHYSINVIVHHYYDLALQIGINMDIQLILPEKINIADIDLCIVFGNLLENAIESCKSQKESYRFIMIHAGLIGTNIIITVDNSFEGDIFKKNNVFLSSKHEGKGIGVASIQSIAQKYEGLAKFEYENNVFRASVMLQN